MKKVIDKPNSQTVSTIDCGTGYYYGVNADGHKGFITGRHSGKYGVTSIHIANLTNGSSFTTIEDYNLQSLLKSLLASGYEIFQFDSLLGFTDWLKK